MSSIVSGNTLAELAALIGDVARANILSALIDGRALTAGELAWCAGVTAQTASGHLSKLAEAGLILPEKQGRHRYFRLASPEVAHAVETLMALAASGPKRHRPVGPRDAALRMARSCYDHLAGRLGVALADALVSRGWVSASLADVRPDGSRFFCEFGVDLSPQQTASRPVCRACLDWSERRPHLAGQLGAGLFARLLALGWIERTREGRIVAFTEEGRAGFARTFGIDLDALRSPPVEPAQRASAIAASA
jgi:DNA-binding transcriptional ArsR family regulator